MSIVYAHFQQEFLRLRADCSAAHICHPTLFDTVQNNFFIHILDYNLPLFNYGLRSDSLLPLFSNIYWALCLAVYSCHNIGVKVIEIMQDPKHSEEIRTKLYNHCKRPFKAE